MRIIVVKKDGTCKMTTSLRKARDEKNVFCYILLTLYKGRLMMIGSGTEIKFAGRVHPKASLIRYHLISEGKKPIEFFWRT